MEQSRISHNLRILKEAGLVESHRIGKWKIYSIHKKNDPDKIISAIRKEMKLSSKDATNLRKCKEENIRQKMRCSKI